MSDYKPCENNDNAVDSENVRILQNNLAIESERYTAEFLYIECLNMLSKKPLYSNLKGIAFRQNACMLHDTMF